jgi:hypothetical protein
MARCVVAQRPVVELEQSGQVARLDEVAVGERHV